MASNSITKLKDQLESARGSIRKVRASAARHETEQVVMSAAGSYAVGVMESKGIKLPTILGLDPKYVLGAICLLGATRVKGTSQAVVLGLGQGALCAAAYGQGLGKGYRISGDSDDWDSGPGQRNEGFDL